MLFRIIEDLKDMLVEMGAEWLTQAFHKTGVLPRDNAVTKITDAKEFVGGGAGLKCTFTAPWLFFRYSFSFF